MKNLLNRALLESQLFEAVLRSNQDQVLKILLQQPSVLHRLFKKQHYFALNKPEKISYFTPLHVAIQNNDHDMVKLLLNEGALVNCQINAINRLSCISFVSDMFLWSGLGYLVLQTLFIHDLKEIQFALLNFLVWFLMHIAFQNSLNKLQYALKNSPSPLYLAQEKGYIEIEQLLRSKGATLTRQEAKESILPSMLTI